MFGDGWVGGFIVWMFYGHIALEAGCVAFREKLWCGGRKGGWVGGVGGGMKAILALVS